MDMEPTANAASRGAAPELGTAVRPIENRAQAAGPTEGTPQARRNLFGAADAPEKRAVRIRLPPLRYITEAKQADRQKALSPAEEEQKELNRIIREQLRSNQEQVERTAEGFECPLMLAQPRKVLVRPNGIRYEKGVDCQWLGPQMSKVSIASDGLKYDFSQITKHIRKNMHRELRSPVTGESITAQVYYTIKCKKTKKLKTMTWTPELYETDEASEPDVDLDPNKAALDVPAAPLVVD